MILAQKRLRAFQHCSYTIVHVRHPFGNPSNRNKNGARDFERAMLAHGFFLFVSNRSLEVVDSARCLLVIQIPVKSGWIFHDENRVFPSFSQWCFHLQREYHQCG